MNKARIESFSKKLRQIVLSLKTLIAEVLSSKPKMIGLAAAILVLVFIIVLVAHSGKKPVDEAADVTVDSQIEDIAATTEPAVLDTQPVGIPATMGTVTTDNLSICKDAGFVIDIEEYYAAGDRVEIHETKNMNGVRWGYTGKGWVNMASVRMDDVPPRSGDPANPAGTEIVSNGSYAVLGYGVVDLGTLNVRVGPGTDYTKVKEISQGIRYAYYEESDGWVRIGDGWVSTEYFYIEGTTAEDSTVGIVAADELNVRTGPDTSFKRVASYYEEDSIELLALVNGWAYTEKGWVSMIYVDLPEPVYTTGSATVTIGLNIREEPDADSQKVDTYREGDRIVILEVKDGWGRTDKGWINLDYVKYD